MRVSRFLIFLHHPGPCATAGQKFGGHNFTKVVNSENAEVDDLSVIRDGDHLFLLPNDC